MKPPSGLIGRLQVLAGMALACVSAMALLTGFSWTLPGGAAWTAQELAQLRSMSLDQLPAPPHDPSNAVDDNPAAAALGKRLFFDTRMSANQAVACANCHAPEQQFQDGRPVGKGVGTGSRRTMPIAAAAHSPWFFWDGRKDSLWSQALGPLEDAAEHGSNRLRIAKLLQEHYRSEYAALFGPLPDLSGLPDDASPQGDTAERAAWQAMAPQRREQVNRIFANLGKAIAAYERGLQPGESRFDAYVRSLTTNDVTNQQALSAQEVRGLRLFIGKGQCATCHNGPLFTDQHFHNTGVPQRDPAHADRGRFIATAKVQRDEFNCLGKFSDATSQDCQELRFMVSDDPALEAAFKTPSLRNVAQRAPFMHAGQFADLETVIAHYVKSPAAAIGHSELSRPDHVHADRKPIRLSDTEAQDLAAFLRSLNGTVLDNTRNNKANLAASITR